MISLWFSYKSHCHTEGVTWLWYFVHNRVTICNRWIHFSWKCKTHRHIKRGHSSCIRLFLSNYLIHLEEQGLSGLHEANAGRVYSYVMVEIKPSGKVIFRTRKLVCWWINMLTFKILSIGPIISSHFHRIVPAFPWNFQLIVGLLSIWSSVYVARSPSWSTRNG